MKSKIELMCSLPVKSLYRLDGMTKLDIKTNFEAKWNKLCKS